MIISNLKDNVFSKFGFRAMFAEDKPIKSNTLKNLSSSYAAYASNEGQQQITIKKEKTKNKDNVSEYIPYNNNQNQHYNNQNQYEKIDLNTLINLQSSHHVGQDEFSIVRNQDNKPPKNINKQLKTPLQSESNQLIMLEEEKLKQIQMLNQYELNNNNKNKQVKLEPKKQQINFSNDAFIEGQQQKFEPNDTFMERQRQTLEQQFGILTNIKAQLIKCELLENKNILSERLYIYEHNVAIEELQQEHTKQQNEIQDMIDNLTNNEN